LRDPLAATQLGDTVLAAQAFQHDPDLLLGPIMLARRPSDVLNDLSQPVPSMIEFAVSSSLL